jgi:hypothetical protein
MIKFIVAGLWLCAVTIGAVIYSFQSSIATATAEPPAPLLGGLDYLATPVVSVPVLAKGGVAGYFLTKLVYTVEPEKLRKLSAPADVMIADELYTYLYSNPTINFTEVEKLDLDALRKGVREAINRRVGDELIHDVMVEQIDFLTKSEIRDNARRRISRDAEKPEASPEHAEGEAAGDGHGAPEEKPAH